jgi:hypothetical protein
MGIVDVYVLVGLCMMMSFLINNKIDDGGFFDWYQKKIAMGSFQRQ